MITTMDFVTWLNHKLDEKGWSRSEAARRGGISASSYDKVIGGFAKPGIRFCKAVAVAFDVPEEDVFRLAGLMTTQTTRMRNHIKPRRIVYQVDNGEAIEQLIALWKQLQPDDQSVVLELMERLVRLPEPRIIGDEPPEG
jgi:transcriptional regulator with XRE-family HTH domain